MDVDVFQVPLKLNESKTYNCREVLEILIPVGIQSQWNIVVADLQMLFFFLCWQMGWN